jgi:hypothetical protein
MILILLRADKKRCVLKFISEKLPLFQSFLHELSGKLDFLTHTSTYEYTPASQ